MRYTGFKLTENETSQVTEYVKSIADIDLLGIEDSMKVMELTIAEEMERLAMVALMEGALLILERDGIASFESGLFPVKGKHVPVLLFWLNGKAMTKKHGASERGEILSPISTNRNHIGKVLSTIVELGASHPEYVSELLYTCYQQFKASINGLAGSFWTKKRKLDALEQLEAVYERYMVNPEAQATVA